MAYRVRTRRAAALFLVLALHSTTAAAFDPRKLITQYVLDTWNVEDGLPINTVVAVAQTPDGYVWLATEEGLVRFDGLRIDAFLMKLIVSP